MKTYRRADARAARILSIGDNRRQYQQSLNEVKQQETSKVGAARRRLEIHTALEPLILFYAITPVPRDVWRATMAIFNQVIEKLATGAPRVTAIFTPERLTGTADTSGALPDFRAGRDI